MKKGKNKERKKGRCEGMKIWRKGRSVGNTEQKGEHWETYEGRNKEAKARKKTEIKGKKEEVNEITVNKGVNEGNERDK